jgi:small-conductance mechanosensitive channel
MSDREWLERTGRIDVESLPNFLFFSDPYGNTALRWLAALALAVVVFFLLWMLKAILVRRSRKLAQWRTTAWIAVVADVVKATRLWFLLVMAVYAGSLLLTLAPGVTPGRVREAVAAWTVGRVVMSIAFVALAIQVGIWTNVLVAYWIQRYTEQKMEADAASVTTMKALGFLSKLVIWVVVLLLALENVGVDVTAMVAGLGVAGIAVGLAAQNILGDLFASASIVLDKPFVLGDFIIVGDKMGTVEDIGLKTTRLRSLTGEQLIFSNNDLLQSRVHNYKRMQKRRIVFTIGVTYQTPYEKVAAIPGMLREIIEPRESVRFDRAHFKAYGDFSLIYEVVYWVDSPDFNLYMDIQQAINLAIYQRFEQEGIEFAYPTQTIFLAKEAM